jgi:cysteine desulfurase
VSKNIYLDYAATTPLDPKVAEKMCLALSSPEQFGNPNSKHFWGRKAAELIDIARSQVASAINASPEGVVFTSGATEANNLAIKGIAEFHQRRGKHIIACATDHHAVLDPCEYLKHQGYEITYLTPQKNGLINLEEYTQALRNDTILVSTVYVNSETGVIQNAEKIIELAHEKGIFCHLDAAQAIGKIPLDVVRLNVDLMSFSAHKVYGPKGIGALYIKQNPRVRLSAQIQGGGQEHGIRSGTLATHQIIGMGEAFALAEKNLTVDRQQVLELKNTLWSQLSVLDQISLNSDSTCTVSNILNVSFGGIDNARLMEALPHLAMSTGSACTSGSPEPSYVLRAMGMSRERAAGALRFSFGRFTTMQEIEQVGREIVTKVHEIHSKNA